MANVGINITHSDFSSFNSDGYIAHIIAKQRDKSIPELKFIFEQTVDGWENKPIFKGEQKVTGSSVTLSVTPTGPGAKIYALVSLGSPPHTIRPRNGGFLRFQPGYRSSTRPRVLSSRAKQRFGEYVGAQQVSHPGFEAREFAKTIMDTYAPIFFADMQDAMKR